MIKIDKWQLNVWIYININEEDNMFHGGDGLVWRGLWRVNWQLLGAMINANLNFWEPCRIVLIRVCWCLQHRFLFCPCSLMQFWLRSLLFPFGPVFEHWYGRTASETVLFPNVVISHSIHSCTPRGIFAFQYYWFKILTEFVALILFL